MELLTKDELAAKLKVSRLTVGRYVKLGMPYYKVQRAIRFDFEEVKAWLRAKTDEVKNDK